MKNKRKTGCRGKYPAKHLRMTELPKIHKTGIIPSGYKPCFRMELFFLIGKFPLCGAGTA